MLVDVDEGLHEWPGDVDTTWKENYYWNLADRRAGIWGFSHVSIIRTAAIAVFSALYMVDGRVRFYRNEVAIDDGEVALSDGTVSAEVLEPFKRHRVVVDTPEYLLELDYEARFPVFDFSGRKIAANRSRMKHLSHKRYEQGMKVRGTCTLKEREGAAPITIDCLAHRDHSWGRREESKIDGWNWAAVQLDNKTINVTRSFTGDIFNVNGFISTPEGNTGVREMEFETLEFEKDGRTPVATRYTFKDDRGKTWHLRSQRFSDLFEPMKDARGKQSTVIYENFADYVLEETGETGWGIDEYQRHYRS